MYAVIKTGGKQYRVQPGDTIVVEKLDGDAGAELKFDSVLMLGGDKGVTLGAPLIDGAFVGATLVETRKGEKIKIFKKTRRQGYRRTNGHRQMESVLRITGIEGAGETAKVGRHGRSDHQGRDQPASPQPGHARRDLFAGFDRDGRDRRGRRRGQGRRGRELGSRQEGPGQEEGRAQG